MCLKMPGDPNNVLFNVEKLYSVYFSLVKNATSILFGTMANLYRRWSKRPPKNYTVQKVCISFFALSMTILKVYPENI